MDIYGIKNCNTVKSALDWLKTHDVDFVFHDYKKEGVTAEKLKLWIGQVGWEKLVNTRGLTWRQLDEDTKAKIKDEKSAIGLMMEKTSVIKRPLIEKNGKVLLLGFDEPAYDKLFS